jgi:hypothetical protein
LSHSPLGASASSGTFPGTSLRLPGRQAGCVPGWVQSPLRG